MRFSADLTLLLSSLFVIGACEAFVPQKGATRTFSVAPQTGGDVSTKQTASEASSLLAFAPRNRVRSRDPPLVILSAKKKVNAKAATLEALEALEDQVDLMDAPLSKKEQQELLKKRKKMEQQQQEEEDQIPVNGSKNEAINGANGESIPMSKKEKMLAKALELEALDGAAASTSTDNNDDNDTPQHSKKELKALKKKEEKMTAKAAAKAEKKSQRASELEAASSDTEESNSVDAKEEGVQIVVASGDAGPASENDDASTTSAPKVTLEDKIRKERPPPRIRVMESAQPGYVSLRMENVGITFRNQEVLKDVTWGVQSGDRIGLVGKNGAGKTTQLRIMAGELEPTTGDVVKSSIDLRTAILRQEFVDELVKERTLKEEFLSVFEEENQILQDLKDAEDQLETMSDADPDAMQEILDRMQDLQQKAEDKDVYVLESRVKKTMDLMGFNDDEADDLVASFSGGWKMRIGLGKVLLKDPNILLLDEPVSQIVAMVFCFWRSNLDQSFGLQKLTDSLVLLLRVSFNRLITLTLIVWNGLRPF